MDLYFLGDLMDQCNFYKSRGKLQSEILMSLDVKNLEQMFSNEGQKPNKWKIIENVKKQERKSTWKVN